MIPIYGFAGAVITRLGHADANASAAVADMRELCITYVNLMTHFEKSLMAQKVI